MDMMQLLPGSINSPPESESLARPSVHCRRRAAAVRTEIEFEAASPVTTTNVESSIRRCHSSE